MSTIHSYIRPNTFVFLRLSSTGLLKLVEVQPDGIIDVGKLGSFSSNLLLGRPYFNTYELSGKDEGGADTRLTIVPTSELNAEYLVDKDNSPEDSEGPSTPAIDSSSYGHDAITKDPTLLGRNNRLTVDDPSRQALSQNDIEELKRSAGGREIVEKILANHAGLEEKTAFSKAKYTLRKTKKYLPRFTVLPVTIGNVIDYITEKEPGRILEMRQETLGLIMAWSNVHYTSEESPSLDAQGKRVGGSRWLLADETGGLVTAAMAERLGVLYDTKQASSNLLVSTRAETMQRRDTDDSSMDAMDLAPESRATPIAEARFYCDFPIPSATNSLTILHPATQPNLSLFKYFGYDTNQPDTMHPIHKHVKPISYLQLLYPEEDPLYREPELVPDDVLQTWKSGKRGTYFKKRRRWMRCKSIIDETREGGFDGLVVASNMDPCSVLSHTVHLVRGGGNVVVYSPTVEPLVQLIDYYSRERRAAYIQHLAKAETPDPIDFPLDPRLLLAPTIQTTRIRPWQVLPGRTHPLMTGRGGAECYVFTARRVIPLDGGVEARGNFAAKKRKVDEARLDTVTNA